MIRGVGYIIENEFFNDGQLQLLMDSVNSNTNLDKNSAKELTDKLSLLSLSLIHIFTAILCYNTNFIIFRWHYNICLDL